jgi:hypothetical protein
VEAEEIGCAKFSGKNAERIAAIKLINSGDRIMDLRNYIARHLFFKKSIMFITIL